MDSDPNRGVLFVLSVVITGTFCCFGFIGNILSLIVLVKDKRKNSNVYLLIALAVSDWLMLGFIFNGVVVIQICKFMDHMECLIWMQQVLRTLWALGCTVQLATAWCVVAVTWDRVMAISKPFKAMKKTEHISRAKKLIALVFIFSVAFNIPRWFHFRIIRSDSILSKVPSVTDTNETASFYNASRSFGDGVGRHEYSENCNAYSVDSNIPCNFSFYSKLSEPAVMEEQKTVTNTYLWQDKTYHYLYYIVLSWLFYYIIPIGSLVILNSILIRQIRMCIKNQEEIAPASRRGRRDSVSITVNIVAVVTIFVICQIPDFIHSLITGPDIGISKVSKAYLGAVAYVFLSFNSSINFGVYCLFYGRFRKRLLVMFCPRFSRHETKNRLFNNGSLTSHSYL